MRGQLIPLTIVALFVLGTLASAAPATQSQIDAAEAGMDNQGPLGEDVLQGTWQTRNEFHKLYLETTGYQFDANVGGCGNYNSNRAEAVLHEAGVEPVTGGYSSATFDIASVTNEFTLNRLQGEFSIGSGGNTDVLFELLDDTTVLASRVVEFDGAVPQNLGVNEYFGVVTINGVALVGVDTTVQTDVFINLVDESNPLVIAEGAQLKLRVTGVPGSGGIGGQSTGDTDTVDTVFYYGCNGARNRIDMIGDTARINVWTEDHNGEVTTAFPTAQDAPSEDRLVRTHVVHVNALGTTSKSDPVEFHTSVLKILDKDGLERSASITDFRINQRIVHATAPGMQYVEYVTQYPENFKDKNDAAYDGAVTMQIFGDRGQNWKVDHKIAIGGAQVELNLAEFEDATKTILLGEETTFLFTLRNGGLVQDDVIITGQEVNGWGVEALVDSVNLAPGETRTFPVTIEPPAGAISGDFQSFDISAISSRTGRTDSETVTVILTNIETNGVELLASQLETVKLSAGQTKSIGLTVKNTGNSAESFSISTAGAPLGWQAKLTPSNAELGAKSQTGTLLSMTAPADAKQGDKFALTVTVRSIVDNSIKDVIVVPYEVFFREEFTIGVSHESVAGVFQNYETTLADMQAFADSGNVIPAPGIHTIRDEGEDGRPTGTSNDCIDLVVTNLDCLPASKWDGDTDPDIDYDQSTMFRLVLTNHGSRDDTIRLLPNWVYDAAWQSLDNEECEEDDNTGSGDGVPDGWRFRYWEADTPLPAALTGEGQNPHDEKHGAVGALRLPADVKTVDLEAGETKIVWVEMGWRTALRIDDADSGTGIECPESGVQGSADGNRHGASTNQDRARDPTKNAVVRFQAESLRDLTQVKEVYVRAHFEPDASQTRDASQRYESKHNNVFLGLDPATYSNPDQVKFQNVHLAAGSATDRTADFHLRVVNSGNEQDTIRVEIPINTDAYEYFITEAAHEAGVVTQNWVDHNPGNPRAIGCTDPSGKTFMDCTLGAFDEIDFNVNVRAKTDKVPIGQLHTFQVRATSMDSLATPGAATTSLVTLKALATGTHAFAITQPVVADGIHDVDVYPGQSIKVPFTIANQGTSFDNYQVDLLETVPEDSGWEAFMGFNSPQFLAAGKDHAGFVTISAPADAAAGDSETVRVRVASLDGVDVPQRTLRIQANVIADPVGIDVVADPLEVVGFPGGTVDMTFKATRTSGLATSVDFSLDEDSLPTGWSVVGDATPAAVTYDPTGKAEHTFTIQVPSDAVGSSRVPITVTAKDSNNNQHITQGVITLDASAFGVHLSSPEDFEAEEITTNVVAGSKVEIPVRVQNLGSGIDQVGLSTSTLPAGWQVTYSEGNPDAASFQPFEARTVIVTVVAPEGVAPGQGIDIVLKGTSVNDPTRTDTIDLVVRTGQSILEVGLPAAPTRYVAPLEEVVYNYAVLNNGTVRDEITFTAGLSAAYEDLLQVDFTPASAILGPGESASVTARLKVPEGFLPNAVIPLKLEATSDGPLLNAFGERAVEVRVLDHRTLDIDNDGNPEYAVDRNRDGSDGFEDFSDPVMTGKRSVSLDMTQFLTPAAVEDWTVLVTDNGTTFDVFAFQFDLTGDGRIDHFIDDDQDNLPDTFWDATTGGRDVLDTTFDVTQDGVREYFVDVDSDGLLDVWYDITTGKVGQLLKLDVDGDGTPDFVVDLDGDGMHDDGEPVLFGKDGKITKITQSIDVNGDGRPDLVVDEDGDGIPDYFVPAGKTRGVPIVLEDVNGDGVEDWTYDANNDGRRDSYYDPVTGQTGSIDTGSEFIDGLARYWYVPTLFALVTVLFVVLVVVTRR